MAYKFEVNGYYFRVTDTVTSDILIHETRETLKWTIDDDGLYQFIQKGAVPKSFDGVSGTLLNVGQAFAFADIVDETLSAFASETVLQDWLSTYVGYICCSSVDIEVNDVSYGSVPSGTILEVDVNDGVSPVTPDSVSLVGNTLTVAVTTGGSAPAGATLMKTGQTTSYRTGDDGDIEAGRATDFFTLNYTNPFGNTNRFTDELGGSTYTNNIVIDWSTYDNVAGTVLGYYRTLLATDTWANQIDACLALSIGTFTSAWRLTNHNEFSNVYAMTDNVFSGRFDGLNYAPFSIPIGSYIWTSTSRDANFAVAHLLNSSGNFGVILSNKANTYPSLACRTFTVTGTTLS